MNLSNLIWMFLKKGNHVQEYYREKLMESFYENIIISFIF